MKIRLHQKDQGIAIIIVMVSIFVLSILAGGFAYSMKVESRLAVTANSGNELEWMGRSGIEIARFVLGQERKIPNTPQVSLNQVWAGGPGETNDPLAGWTMKDIPLGEGMIREITITDAERKFNINLAANPDTLPL